ncbi:HD domain-containing protein [Deminuibacter soli]|uniref:HD domain-containing protein n=1 Tax=Deminuibacter soli TaxID=2291815 RepID=A0A3E1NPC4_9BACT|nr:HD domain-containing protein [Deminuibacter soli]RFM29789.1 HD domain-containing protein [Deminuibacter soli]
MTKRKIINDPVHGFITINHPLIFDIISHPYYQRLRRIRQMALAQLVYPGAVHTRLHHSLGAYHLMCLAVTELKSKGADITPEEEVAVKAGILLHDIGHGPFSHALEHVLLPGVHHEQMSLRIMQAMNDEFDGRLELAIRIFTGQYHKPFLHQLISGQLDTDRMDYLTRDSFFTGVSEGVIGYDRILKMLVVHNDELLVEEKGIYSVEKFLIARRQMYWQVYLHKVVLAAEKMMVKLMERARQIFDPADSFLVTNSPLDYFLGSSSHWQQHLSLDAFCNMDDEDVLFAIKRWSHHPDIVLSTLSKGLLNRKLLKCRLQAEEVNPAEVAQKTREIAQRLQISEADAGYLVFTGEAINTTYLLGDERIKILFKDGQVKDISQVDNPLIHQTLSTPVKKFYFCTMA